MSDPASARSSPVRTTAEGTRVRQRAQTALALIEQTLADRIGADAATALRRALSEPWGELPSVEAP
ncbi:hypothetical protein [Streptomyces avermitilis]|uniref:hypothetical protein n=1 Tax=Streptomyces avermitilis TaxID=33903 RepID=UPI0033A199B8